MSTEHAQKVIVCRCWGDDKLGIADAFMRVIAEHGCQIIDLSQFILEDRLLFACELQVAAEASDKLVAQLNGCAKEHSLDIDLYFPDKVDAGAEDASDSVAVLSLVSKGDVSKGLLCSVDEVLCQHGCAIREIEFRNDNKREINADMNKVEIRISCPKMLKLSALSIGLPEANGAQPQGLQSVVWQHGAEMSIRWWDAMNRPNGKSLVVFGISEELCACNVLDEILKEAGLDPSTAPVDGGKDNVVDAKVAMLKGKSAQVVQKVCERLEFTPGARLLCSALKRLGCRLAVLTSLGIKAVADHVKRELDMDYAITRDLEVVDGLFTGGYKGDLSEVRFRKADLLTLLADREGIEHRNVILIGKEITHLKARHARELVDCFGPSVHFSPSSKDLSMALYLLGFNGADVRALRRRRCEEVPATWATPTARAKEQQVFSMQISAKRREPGQLGRILKPLGDAGVDISAASMCCLQDGSMCMGLDLRAGAHDKPDALWQALLDGCKGGSFQILGSGSRTTTVPARIEDSGVDQWASFHRRYAVTVVQKPRLTSESLAKLFSVFGAHAINIVHTERLSANEIAALQFIINLPSGVEQEKISAELTEASQLLGVDIAFQKDDLERWMRRLVVFDMDSTLIQQEVIDELAKYAGVEKEVSEITEAAMRGDLNFYESLKARVALLKGHKAEELFSKVKAQLIYTPGAKKLCSTLRRLGFKMAVISGGFLPVAREVQRHLGLDYAFANTLKVDETTGILSGDTSGPVVTPQRKRALLATIADVEGCEMQQTIAVGDGANDIPMLHAAGLGIAFCAKPKVQAVSEFRINQKDLSTVLFLIGVSEHAAARLGVEGSDA